jgi:enamine deaminase RidA (YjgF/YER057c/UK114 family)
MAPSLHEWEEKLPKMPSPVANYALFRRSGSLAFTSGIIPIVEGRLKATGRLGDEVDLEEGYELARTCGLLTLSVLKEGLGSLTRVSKVLQLVVYVASAKGFVDQPKVADGASDLLVEVFGDAGKPTRLAVGVSMLPLGAPVEISTVVEVSE